MNSFIRTKDHITVVFESGQSATMYTSNPDYHEVVQAIRAEDWTGVKEWMIPSVKVKATVEKAGYGQSGRVQIVGGVVHVDGNELHNTLADRIMEMIEDGFDITPIAKFLENLLENPSYRAVNELYGFLEKSELPITSDGCFIAYKRVRGDYKDLRTGTFDNSIGMICQMHRNQVDEDKNKACSSGLHFCSREYLPSYGTGEYSRTVVVKINPKDVVSIPIDYDQAKGRCCYYEVIGELTHNDEEKIEGAIHDPEPMQKEKETPPPKETVKIEQLDPDNNAIINTFNNVEEASEWCGANPSNIRRVLRGDRKTTAGYGWRYFKPSSERMVPYMNEETLDALETMEKYYSDLEEELDELMDATVDPYEEMTLKSGGLNENPLDDNTPSTVPVLEQFDPKTSIVVNVFANTQVASQSTGIHSSGIRNAIDGKVDEAGGFGWRMTNQRAASGSLTSSIKRPFGDGSVLDDPFEDTENDPDWDWDPDR